MPSQEHRRVANQPRGPLSREQWEQFRRALLMLAAQYKAADPEGCYAIDVRVVLRDRAPSPIS